MNKLWQGILTGFVCACLALVLWSVGILFQPLERAAWTWRVDYFKAPSPSTGQIKIVVVDEASITWARDEMGLTWPWPRQVYVPLLDYFKRAGVRAVGFDILFPDPSPHDIYQDIELGEAIKRGPPFVGALFLGDEAGARGGWPEYQTGRTLEVGGLMGATALSKSLMPVTALFPIPEVSSNATWLADVQGTPDEDSVVRRAHLVKSFDGQAVPTFALGMFLAGEAKPSVLQWNPGELRAGERRWPLSKEGKTILRYRGPPGTYPRYSAAELIQSELRMQEGLVPTINPDELKDAYVLVGLSAPGLLDLRPTPLSRVAPGVEIHASLLDNLLEADLIRAVPKKVTVLFTLALCMLTGVLIRFGRTGGQNAIAIVCCAAIPWVAGFMGYTYGYWWPIMVSMAAVVMTLLGGVVLNYAIEGRQKAFIKNAFKHYLSHDVIDRLLEEPGRLQLGGERRELTIFFSDLQGFSSISERLEPQELTTLLNEYLTDMTQIILEEGGTLDKYEGDAIIAFWNAPVDQPDHAERGCRAALRCQRKLAERREEFKKRTGEELHMRIGVNTGVVVVGNMGSVERFDYTVLGDAANLAARLEGANKAFNTFTMIAESTWEQRRGVVEGRMLGRLRVVGRETPVTVYEPTCLGGETASPDHEAFDKALVSCYGGAWQDAVRQFESLEDDPVAAKYAQRCREVLLKGSDRWDGVWNLTEK